MSTLVLRSVKGAALTSTEIDANFDNLNTGKVESATPVFSGLVTLPSQSIVLTESNLPDVAPSLNLDFANSKQLDSRITFGRGSGGAYYDGKTTAMAEQNLLLWSQDFTQAYWKAFSAVTATGNAIAAPDGTVTATQIAANAVSTNNGSFENTVGAPLGSTITVYAKAGNVDYLAIGSAQPNAWASFNLTTGTTGNSFACTTSIVSMGNGWYRCVMANITTALIRILFAMKSTDVTADPWSNGTVAIGDYIYIWGAQLEQRSSATAYTPTTTSAITNYIPVLLQAPLNTPRFDHDSRPTFNGTCTVSGSSVTLPTTFSDGSSPSTINNFYTGSITISGTAYVITNYVGSTRVVTVTGSPTAGAFSLVNKNYGQSLGLLIEELRTNLLTYSSNFVNGGWAQSLVTISAPTIIAPDGTLTGVKFIPTAVSTTHFTYRNVLSGIVNNTKYTTSIYVKKGEYNTFTINLNNNYNTFVVSNITFNLTTGKIDSASGSVTATYSMTPAGNGWYRCSVTDTTTSAVTSGSMRTNFYVTTNATYTGDGYSGVYIWGAQLETGSFATSYIPTPSNATVTRLADVASMTGTNFSSWYNQAEGTMYAKLTSNVPDKSDGTGMYYVNSIANFNIAAGVGFGLNVSNSSSRVYRLGFGSRSTTGATAFIETPDNAVPQYVESKVIGSYTTSSSTASVTANGNTVVTDTIPIVAACTYLQIMPSLSGHIRKLTYYPKALSAPQLQGLTK